MKIKVVYKTGRIFESDKIIDLVVTKDYDLVYSKKEGKCSIPMAEIDYVKVD